MRVGFNFVTRDPKNDGGQAVSTAIGFTKLQSVSGSLLLNDSNSDSDKATGRHESVATQTPPAIRPYAVISSTYKFCTLNFISVRPRHIGRNP